jgi:hypothetical protein
VSVADSNLPIALDCASERQSRSLEVARAVVELCSATPGQSIHRFPGTQPCPFANWALPTWRPAVRLGLLDMAGSGRSTRGASELT